MFGAVDFWRRGGSGNARRLAPGFVLSLSSLTLMEEKGYVGGLGASASDCLHIGLVGFLPDDPGVSFTVCGSRYFGNLAHDCRKTVSVTDTADVRRFDVKDTQRCVST